MSTRYRVIVEQVEDIKGAQYETRETVLFETVSPNLASLLRYAPTEVDAALRTAFGDVEPWDLDRAAAGVPAVPVTEGEARVDANAAAPAAGEPEPDTETGRPKRKRRTKAEMEADRLAELATSQSAEGNTAPTSSWPTPDEAAANVAALNQVDNPDASPADPELVNVPVAAPIYNPFEIK